MLSVAVIGARRRRQGIGEHVARHLHRNGAAVRAIVGTTPESVAEACAALAAAHGLRCRGYASVEALLDAEGQALDALAVCSPIEAHAAGLEAALAARLHALCEKPLTNGAADLGAEARAFATRFAAAGRYLATVTQWPHTLAAFRRLYPEADLDRRPPRRFAMRLSPISRGRAMLVDSLSHPLSLLRALVGPGRAEPRGVEWRGDEAATVRFGYEHAAGEVEVEVALARCETQPRPASYAIDGREARREVRMPEYALALVGANGRRVAIEDPLGPLVRDFIARAGRADTPDVDGIASDAAALDAILRSCG